jgi:NADPH2 dehydrogenase
MKSAEDAGAKTPRPLTKEEIATYVEDYANAAYDLITKAGFDGIELHGANGTLIDQFIQDVSNQRTDDYGGSIENRSRFALEVLEAVTKRIGQEKTSLRISPWNRSGGTCNAELPKNFSTDKAHIRYGNG